MVRRSTGNAGPRIQIRMTLQEGGRDDESVLEKGRREREKIER